MYESKIQRWHCHSTVARGVLGVRVRAMRGCASEIVPPVRSWGCRTQLCDSGFGFLCGCHCWRCCCCLFGQNHPCGRLLELRRRRGARAGPSSPSSPACRGRREVNRGGRPCGGRERSPSSTTKRLPPLLPLRYELLTALLRTGACGCTRQARSKGHKGTNT